MLAALALSAAIVAPSHQAVAGPACTYSIFNGRSVAIVGYTAQTEDAHLTVTYSVTGRVWHRKMNGQLRLIHVIPQQRPTLTADQVVVTVAGHGCTPS